MATHTYPAILYQFAKKINSTKRPNDSDTPAATPRLSITVEIMEPFNILEPTIKLINHLDTDTNLSTSFEQYNYIFLGRHHNTLPDTVNRYYWVTNWRREYGVWYADLHTDPLASWRPEILSSEQFVLRSEYGYNTKIFDNFLTLPEVHVKSGAYNTLEEFNYRTDLAQVPNDECHWLIGIQNDVTLNSYQAGPGIVCYACTRRGISLIKEAFFSNEVDIQNANGFYNPLQYIRFCKYYPFALNHGAPSSQVEIKIGPEIPDWTSEPVGYKQYTIELGTPGVGSGVYEYLSDPVQNFEFSLNIPRRTDSDTDNGTFLYSAQLNSLQLQWPSLGCIDLNPNDYMYGTGGGSFADKKLYVKLRVDVTSGDGLVYLSRNAFTTDDKWEVTDMLPCKFGIDCPLAQVEHDYNREAIARSQKAGAIAGGVIGTVSGVAEIVAGAVTYNPALIGMGVMSTATSLSSSIKGTADASAAIKDASKRTASFLTGNPSFANSGMDLPRVVRYYQDVKIQPKVRYGGPVHEYKKLSDLKGTHDTCFVLCDNAAIDNESYDKLPGHYCGKATESMLLAERQEICNLLNGGIYLE